MVSSSVKSVTTKIICSLHNVNKADFDGFLSQLTKKLAEIIVIFRNVRIKKKPIFILILLSGTGFTKLVIRLLAFQSSLDPDLESTFENWVHWPLAGNFGERINSDDFDGNWNLIQKSNMIQKNEIIKVISNLNFDGFLKGTNEANETGLVPSNFVQLIK